MSGIWKDISTAVLASTVYVDGELVARNPSVTLPEITLTTAEVNVGGTIEVPITGQIDAMECSITFGGPDSGMAAALGLTSHDFEVRFVQDVMDNEGVVSQVGCKAFMRGAAKTIPGIAVEVGENSENELTLGVTRYQLYVDGEEMLCIDQLNNIMRVNGTDYAGNYVSML